MLAELFDILSRAIEVSPGVALGAALVWGILSILLSPCHLASIPLIVGFIGGHETLSTRSALGMSSAFAGGMLITIGVVGAVTAGAGHVAGDLGGYADYFVTAILLLVGLHMIGVIPLNMPAADPSSSAGRGAAAAFVLGLVFGIALGPCTFAFMAPVLAVVFRSAASVPIYAAALLLAYGVGHCSVIVAAGTSTDMVQRYVRWTDKSAMSEIIKKTCGV
ncbi:MAG: cytochrome c biogenesis protein CcdA, partial [Armatimonadota bacterium]